MSAESDLLKIEDIMQRLGLKRRAVENLVAGRKIPVIRITKRCIRFRWKEVEAALAKLTVRAL